MSITDDFAPTPSQLRFANEHRARIDRMARAARRPAPVAVPAPAPPPAPVAINEAPSWAERQKEIWFSIIGEIESPPPPPISTILKICAKHYGLLATDLRSPRRTGPIVRVRHIAMFLSKEFTQRSLPEIGRQFGMRDHTTVLYAVRKIERWRKTDPGLESDLNLLRAEIGRAIR